MFAMKTSCCDSHSLTQKGFLEYGGVIEVLSRTPQLSLDALRLILWYGMDYARNRRPFIVRQTIAQSLVEKKIL